MPRDEVIDDDELREHDKEARYRRHAGTGDQTILSDKTRRSYAFEGAQANEAVPRSQLGAYETSSKTRRGKGGITSDPVSDLSSSFARASMKDNDAPLSRGNYTHAPIRHGDASNLLETRSSSKKKRTRYSHSSGKYSDDQVFGSRTGAHVQGQDQYLDEEDEDEPSQPQSSGKAPSSRYKIKESTGRRSEARHSVTRQSEIYYEPDASQEPALIEDIPWEEVAADVAVPVVNYSHTAAFTDPDLLETGGRARAYIAGKPEAPIEQELDPNFIIQPKPKNFFVPGRIIKTYWPEVAGSSRDKGTVVTAIGTRFQDVKVYGKIRWFAVVKQGHNSCTCLPITTYGGKGVTKPGVLKSQHSVIHTGSRAPPLLKGEAPASGRQGMLLPIRVVPTRPGDRMENRSRLDYGKIYTVEYNVRIYDFGLVHPDYYEIFMGQWKKVFLAELQKDIMLQEAALAVQTGATNSTRTFERYRRSVSGQVQQDKDSSRPVTQNFTYLDYFQANVDYEPDKGRQDLSIPEIAIQEGDELALVNVIDDHWILVVNKDDDDSMGAVALQYVVRYESVTALFNWETDQDDAEGYATLQADQSVRVLEEEYYVGWTMVWNEQTKERGIVPSNLLQLALEPSHPDAE